MRCGYCGKTLAPDTRVCPVCGKPLIRRPSSGNPAKTGSVQNLFRALIKRLFPNRRKKRRSRFLAPNERWNPKFFAACGGILALIILIPVLIAAIARHAGAEPLDSRAIQTFYSTSSDKTSVVFGGKTFEKAILGKVQTILISEDGLAQAILTEEGALYYVTTEKLEPVANHVCSFLLSADGKKVAYVLQNAPSEDVSGETETTEKEETTKQSARLADESTTEETTEYVPFGGEQYLEYMDTSLFLYNGEDGEAPLVANHVSPDSLALSPDGSNLGYAVTAEDGESFDGFLYSAGVTSSLGKDTLAIAASDDGSHVYYVKYEAIEDGWVQKLFSKVGETEAKLGEFTDGKRLCVYVNRDCSQIVFSFTGKDGAFFHYGLTEEKVKLANGYTPVILSDVHLVANGRSTIVPLDTFTKSAFVRADGMVQYSDQKMNCLDTGASGSILRLTPDLKSLYYLQSDGTLGVCTLRKADKKDLAFNVMNFDLSADGKTVYYVNSDNILHAYSGSRDTVLAENVYAPGSGLCVTDGCYLYFLQNYSYGNGTLCYLKGTGKPRVLTEIDNVHDIAADTDDNIYYRSNYGTISGTYDLYYGKQKKYNLIFKDMG